MKAHRGSRGITPLILNPGTAGRRMIKSPPRSFYPCKLVWMITNWVHGRGSVFGSWLFLSESRNSLHCMEPEGSFSCSQQRATVRIFSHMNPVHALHFNFFNSSLNVVLIFQLVSSLHVSAPKLCLHNTCWGAQIVKPPIMQYCRFEHH